MYRFEHSYLKWLFYIAMGANLCEELCLSNTGGFSIRQPSAGTTPDSDCLMGVSALIPVIY